MLIFQLRGWKCYRKRHPFQGLTLGNKLSQQTNVLTKQKTLLGRGIWAESSRVREPRRTALPLDRRLRFYGNEVSFRVVSGQCF